MIAPLIPSVTQSVQSGEQQLASKTQHNQPSQAPSPIQRRPLQIGFEIQNRRAYATKREINAIVTIGGNDTKIEAKRPNNKEVNRCQNFEPPKNTQALPRMKSMNGAIYSANEGYGISSLYIVASYPVVFVKLDQSCNIDDLIYTEIILVIIL